MKYTRIVALIIVLGFGGYYFLDTYGQKEKILISKLDDIGQKTKIVTDSKVLKSLADSLHKSDWDTFDKVYDAQIAKLRQAGDHRQFYKQFKDLFTENNFSIADADGLLCLLTDTGTKESIHLLFEMFNDGTISNEEVQSRQSIYFLDSIRRILENPTTKVDKQTLMLALKEEYRKTDNEHLKGKAAELIGWYGKVER